MALLRVGKLDKFRVYRPNFHFGSGLWVSIHEAAMLLDAPPRSSCRFGSLLCPKRRS